MVSALGSRVGWTPARKERTNTMNHMTMWYVSVHFAFYILQYSFKDCIQLASESSELSSVLFPRDKSLIASGSASGKITLLLHRKSNHIGGYVRTIVWSSGHKLPLAALINSKSRYLYIVTTFCFCCSRHFFAFLVRKLVIIHLFTRFMFTSSNRPTFILVFSSY